MQVSQRFHNNTYAPGIATYGIDGKTGDVGLPGTSMFFTDFNLTDNNDFKSFASKITSRLLPLKYKEILLDRKYINGDYFITRNGEIYMLKNINELSIYSMNNLLQNNEVVDITEYLEYIGNFSKENPDDIFNTETDIRTDKLIITDSSTNITNDTSALLTLNKTNKGIGKVDFISMNTLYGSAGNMNLNISYDNTLKAFKMESKYPIVLDSNVYIKQDSNIQQTSQYSPILTTNNSITNFYGICNNLTYNIDSSIYTYTKKDSSTLYYGSIYIISLNDILQLNTLNDNDITLHFQNNNFQDFQLFKKEEMIYYFKQDYDFVKLNDLISQIIYNDLDNIQLSLIYNIEIFIKKQNRNIIGYKI